jgi:hypothetical protein
MRLHLVRSTLVAAALFAATSVAFADPVTIDFNGVTSGQHVLGTYNENGFTVTNNSNWYTSTNGGNPIPDLASGQNIGGSTAFNTATFTLSGSGGYFGISSFDVRDFGPNVTYTVIGYIGATVAYTFTGTETATGFSTILLVGDQSILVNSATFTLSIPGASTGTNARYGLDNIDLTEAPEPSSLALLATGMLGMAMFMGRRRLFNT